MKAPTALFLVLTLACSFCEISCLNQKGTAAQTDHQIQLQGIDAQPPKTYQQPIPDSFSASLGGFLGSSQRIKLLNNGNLLYSHNPNTFTSAPGTKTQEAVVTKAQWQEFRQTLDAIPVWEWEEEYMNHEILDGTQWHFHIQYETQSITSRGSNSFPPNGQYARLQAAIKKLLGGELEFD